MIELYIARRDARAEAAMLDGRAAARGRSIAILKLLGERKAQQEDDSRGYIQFLQERNSLMMLERERVDYISIATFLLYIYIIYTARRQDGNGRHLSHGRHGTFLRRAPGSHETPVDRLGRPGMLRPVK